MLWKIIHQIKKRPGANSRDNPQKIWRSSSNNSNNYNNNNISRVSGGGGDDDGEHSFCLCCRIFGKWQPSGVENNKNAMHLQMAKAHASINTYSTIGGFHLDFCGLDTTLSLMHCLIHSLPSFDGFLTS